MREENIRIFLASMIDIQTKLGSSKDAFLAQFGLNRAQSDILYVIDSETRITSTALAKCMKTTTGAVTQIINGLVEAGFVERVSDTNDKRVSFIQFSTEGQQKFDAFRILHLKRVGRLLKYLTDEELETLIRIQQKVLRGNDEEELRS